MQAALLALKLSALCRAAQHPNSMQHPLAEPGLPCGCARSRPSHPVSALTPLHSLPTVKIEEPVSMEMDNHMSDKDDSCYDNAEAAFSDDEEDLNSKGEGRRV